MINVYYRPACLYCQRVRQANETIKAPIQWLDISAVDNSLSELIAKGGRGQVPFLEDTNRGVSMYESLDIIAYLEQYYASEVDRMKIH